MKYFKIILFAITIGSFLVTSTGCNKDGCTVESATNYCSTCKDDDGSCKYINGCTDRYALNYEALAVTNTGCLYPKTGTWNATESCSNWPTGSYDLELTKVSPGVYALGGYFTNDIDLYIDQSVIEIYGVDTNGDEAYGHGTIAVDADGFQYIYLTIKIVDSAGNELYDCINHLWI